MAVVSFTVQFVSAESLAPGAAKGWVMFSIGDSASVAVTAIPGTLAASSPLRISARPAKTTSSATPCVARCSAM